MNVVTEFVKFDDEDRGNIDYEGGEYPYGIHRAEKDHMFFLCYYTPQNQDNIVVPGEGNSKRSKFSSRRILILCLLCQAHVGLPKTSSQTWYKATPVTGVSPDAGKPSLGGGGGGAGVKSGSHMPRSYLRYNSDTSAGAVCNTVPIWEHKSPATEAIAGLDRRHACEDDTSSTSQAWRRSRPAMFLAAGGVIFSYVGVVSQAVSAAMSQAL